MQNNYMSFDKKSLSAKTVLANREKKHSPQHKFYSYLIFLNYNSFSSKPKAIPKG
jgi:hypothetical protein